MPAKKTSTTTPTTECLRVPSCGNTTVIEVVDPDVNRRKWMFADHIETATFNHNSRNLSFKTSTGGDGKVHIPETIDPAVYLAQFGFRVVPLPGREVTPADTPGQVIIDFDSLTSNAVAATERSGGSERSEEEEN